HLDQRGQRVGAHFLHHLASVRFYRGLADAELAPYLFVQEAGGDERHHLALARRERLAFLTKRPAPYLHLQRATTTLACVADGPQQGLGGERLDQELHGSGLHRLHAAAHVAVTGDEDYWQTRPLDLEPPLYLEAGEVRQREVEDETARHRNHRPRQEGPGGC